MTYNIKYIQPDLDIDVSNRDEVLKHFKYIPASKLTSDKIYSHGVGVYFCDVPHDLLTGLCSIDYKKAEEDYGFIKVDILHNTVYDSFKTRTEMIDVLKRKPNWDCLYNKNIVEKLPHINSYYDLLTELPKISSVEELAMFISVIRPGKKYLIDVLKKENNWNCIKDKIWLKEDTGYMYKKSHAISYAVLILLSINKLVNYHTSKDV